MQHQGITAVITALVLGTASLSAWAQPGPRGPYGEAHPTADPGPQRAQPLHVAPAPAKGYVGVASQRPPQARPAVHPPYPPQAHPHGMPPGQAKRMGAGPHHHWKKGSRVPPQYRTDQYVVKDWRSHGLKTPPRGHHWVQNGGDYLLVAMATGVISQLILGY